jgi:BirA family biotin operon repressor/biotin-[acetyl-CoA-carboxylase] ligase
MQGATWKWAVIGIGINVLQDSFHPDIPNPVSLKQISGYSTDIKTLAEKIRDRVMVKILELKEQGFDQLHRQYLDRLYKSGESVLFRIGQQEKPLYICGVTKEGMLETGLEEKVPYAFGEIEWIHKF